MMLSQAELIRALHDGVKDAERCGRLCAYGATIDGDTYRVYHNGTGGRDTDAQTVHLPAVRSLPREKLADRLKAWVAGLHTGVRIDLNAAMETNEWVMGEWARGDGPLLLVGDCGPELISAKRLTFVSEVALTLGKETPFSAAEAARGIADLAEAGASIGEIMYEVCEAINVAVEVAATFEREFNERGPAMAGWPWRADHFAHVENGA